MVTKVVFITTTGGGTFTVPSDFGSLISVEAIGAGAGADTNLGEGSGGGAYAYSNAVTGLTASGTAYYNVGAGGAGGAGGGVGGDTWFNAASNAAPTLTTQGVLAKGGGLTTGGQASASVGTTKYSGGDGGLGTSSNGGGGGAAGPSGAGGAGGTPTSSDAGGGGGGANGGSAGDGGVGTVRGGNGGGTGGGAGGTSSTNAVAGSNGGGGGGGFGSGTFKNGAAGGNGATVWTSTAGPTAGPGGGSGAGVTGTGSTLASGGTYGGGMGNGGSGTASGGQGLIVFTYSTVTYSYSRPDTDSTPLQWSRQPSSGTHFSAIDETSSDPSDYLYALSTGLVDTMTCGSVSQPSAGTSILVNYASLGAVKIELLEGSTVIKSANVTNGSGTITITSAEWASVTSWPWTPTLKITSQ